MYHTLVIPIAWKRILIIYFRSSLILLFFFVYNFVKHILFTCINNITHPEVRAWWYSVVTMYLSWCRDCCLSLTIRCFVLFYYNFVSVIFVVLNDWGKWIKLWFDLIDYSQSFISKLLIIEKIDFGNSVCGVSSW